MTKTNRSQGKITEEYRIEKNVILSLKNNICSNYTLWHEFIISHIGIHYPESKGYMEANVEPVYLVLNEQDYVVPPNTPQWQRERINSDRSDRVKYIKNYNETMKVQRIAIVAFILSKLSVESQLSVKSHNNYRVACPVGQDAVGNPYSLMQIINERHYIVQIDRDTNAEARRNAFRNKFAAMRLEEDEPPAGLATLIN